MQDLLKLIEMKQFSALLVGAKVCGREPNLAPDGPDDRGLGSGQHPSDRVGGETAKRISPNIFPRSTGKCRLY